MTTRATTFFLGLLVLIVVGGAWAAAEPASSSNDKLKAVVHVNFDEAERQKATLGNVEHILAEVGDQKADIVVVCHGPGLSMLTKSDSKLSGKIAELEKRGVQFHACENTMKKESVTKDDLLPGVKTTPSGAVEVLRRQQQGYSYFKP